MEQTETKTEFLRFLGIDMKFTIVMRFSEGSCRWQDDDPFSSMMSYIWNICILYQNDQENLLSSDLSSLHMCWIEQANFCYYLGR